VLRNRALMAIAPKLDSRLREWTAAGVLDAAAADRIRAFEEARAEPRLRWPIILALAFGALLMGAGVLLFVAAHWDEMSPASRFALVLTMVAMFHVGGAFAAQRFDKLAIALHAIGTITLGAGIFLAGQIFNLEEHWPGGVMLWAVGAWLAWFLLRHWTQALLAALLTPAWLMGEWAVRTEHITYSFVVWAVFNLIVALVYLSAARAGERDPVRRALTWAGGLLLLPSALTLASSLRAWEGFWWNAKPNAGVILLGLALAGALPLALAYWLRGRAAWMNAVATAWALLFGSFAFTQRWESATGFIWNAVGPYLVAGAGCAGLIAWGIAEERRERINLGIAGFAITVLVFYFSEVMDKVGRSASLIGLGVLFLFGGWLLEKTRRRLVARMTQGAGA